MRSFVLDDYIYSHGKKEKTTGQFYFFAALYLYVLWHLADQNIVLVAPSNHEEAQTLLM